MKKKVMSPISLRMQINSLRQLDKLCTINERSRREIIERLVERAINEHKADKSTRIT